ncbi:Cytochrome P450 3A13 [Halotydeus destructor]|nr:Cytochrome P450 3A13 [Halotydeus destructor]
MEALNSYMFSSMGIGVVIAATLIYLHLYYKEKYSYWSKRGVDGPKPLPVLGNILANMRRPINEVFYEYSEKYGKIFGIYEMTKPTLGIGDPELIRQITVKDAHLFMNRRNFGDSFGGDDVVKKFLTALRDEDWKRVRTILTPTFTSGKMKKMFPLMEDCCDDAIAYLRKDGQSKNMKQVFSMYTLEIIAQCCFATRPDTYNNPDNKFYVSATGLFQPKRSFFLMIILFSFIPKWIAKKLNLSIFPEEYMTYFKLAIQHLVKERRQTGKRGNDFLQLLIDAQDENGNIEAEADVNELDHAELHHLNQDKDQDKLFDKTKLQNKTLDDNEVIANSILFFAAGSETTASLLSFLFHSLAVNDDVQETLYDEIRSAGKLDYQTVSTLPYLDATIQETLRMYPPALVTDREASEEYAIPGTDIVLEAGSTIFIPIYSVHHDENNYPNPKKYDPTRFLPENRDNIKPYTYLPFGSGPRNCVGMRFALLETKLLIAKLVLAMRVVKTAETVETPKYKSGTGLLACEPLIVSFVQRT